MAAYDEEEEDESYEDSFEASGIVLDCGSGLVKAGFAGGSEKPRAVFPSIIGRPRVNSVKLDKQDLFCGDEALCHKTTISYPITKGIVENWDDMQTLWTHTFDNELRVGADENPVLLSEAPLNPKANREKMCEILFEEFRVPSLRVENQAVLSLYASGRTSGFVVDCGDGVTQITPVSEGYLQEHQVRKSDVAGRELTNYLQKMLKEKGYNLATTLEKELVRDMKEECCFVAKNFEEESKADIEHEYELPDGKRIKIGNEICEVGEILFDTKYLEIEREAVQDLCHASIMECDINLRKQMRQNIVVVGGTSMMKGYPERLKKEIEDLSPPAAQIKVSASPERNYAVWIGGSIMASLPDFENMCLTAEEWQESGREVVHTKFL